MRTPEREIARRDDNTFPRPAGKNESVAELRTKGVTVADGPKDEGYGITAMLRLPGDCNVMIYEPRHPIASAP